MASIGLSQRVDDGNVKWYTLIAVCFALFMAMLDNLVVNIALPTQQDDVPTPDYDGTAELWWDSLEDMFASFKTEIAQKAGLDAGRFSSVREHLLTEEYVVVSGPDNPPKPILH